MKNILLILVLLLVVSCDYKTEESTIISETNFDNLIEHLSNKDVNIVALTLWRISSFDDIRAPDLFISIWEKDGKYRNYYNKDIENNILIRLTVAQTLVQYGYYYAIDVERYLLSKINDPRPNVRNKVAEVLSSVGTVTSVQALYNIVVSDNNQLSITAYKSLLSAAKKEKRLQQPEAVLLARKYINKLYYMRETFRSDLKDYLVNMERPDFEPINNIASEDLGSEARYRSVDVYPEAMILLKPYADNNDPYAKYLIGIKYLDGNEVEKNEEKGVSLLTEAGEAGYNHAYYELATRYASGKGVKLNRELERYYLNLLSKKL